MSVSVPLREEGSVSSQNRIKESQEQELGFPGGASGKEPAYQCRRQEMCIRFLKQEDPLGRGYGDPLQNSCLENPMDRGVWWAIQPVGSQRVGHD